MRRLQEPATGHYPKPYYPVLVISEYYFMTRLIQSSHLRLDFPNAFSRFPTKHFCDCLYYPFFPLWRCGPTRARASSFLRFLDPTQRCITVGRTPLDEWSARRRDLYLTKHNTHNRQTSMPMVGFEPTIAAGERPQTYALDRAATGIGKRFYVRYYITL